MFLFGILLILVASVLHTWHSGHALATPGNAAEGFRAIGPIVLLISIVLLLGGLLLVWRSVSIVAALIAAAIYFFVLPLIMLPLMEWATLIPDRQSRYTTEEWNRKKEFRG